MYRPLVCALILTAFSLPALAQQLEPNDATGKLTSLNTNPVPGSPWVVNVNGLLFLEVRGLANQAFVLAGGQLATTSMQVPTLANQWIDLDLSTAFVAGDGINGSAGYLPAAFFATNANGVASFVFPGTTALLGQTISFQALVTDPTQPVFPLNVTAAGRYVFDAAQTLAGNGFTTYTFPSGPYTIYGQSYSQIAVSSNGWIRFGANAALPEPSPSATRLLAGTVGTTTPVARPIVAPAWMEIQNGGGTTVVEETAPGHTEITWSGGSVLNVTNGSLAPYGTITCVVDQTGPAPVIVFDYTQATVGSFSNPPQASGYPVVGISDGGLAGAAVVAVDLASGGAVTPTSSVSNPTTIYQDMQSPLSAFDLNGLVLTYTDQTGGGAFMLM